MKTIFAFALLLITGTLFAQENAIDKYFKDFQQRNSLEVTSVSSRMFTIFLGSKEGKEKEELAAILKKLTGLKVLNKYVPKKEGMELFNSAWPLIPGDYETILTLNETDRNAKFYTKDDKSGKITELVMVAFQWGRFLVVSITGDINLNDILKLSQNLNLQGLNEVQKVKASKE